MLKICYYFFVAFLISFSFSSTQTSFLEKISWKKLSNNEKGFVIGGGLLFALVAGYGIYYFFVKDKKAEFVICPTRKEKEKIQYPKEKVEKFNTDFLNLSESDSKEIEILSKTDAIDARGEVKRKWVYGILQGNTITLLKHYLLHHEFEQDSSIDVAHFCIESTGNANNILDFTLSNFDSQNMDSGTSRNVSDYDLYILNDDGKKSEEVKFNISDDMIVEDRRDFIAGIKNKTIQDQKIIFTVALKGEFKGAG